MEKTVTEEIYDYVKEEIDKINTFEDLVSHHQFSEVHRLSEGLMQSKEILRLAKEVDDGIIENCSNWRFTFGRFDFYVTPNLELSEKVVVWDDSGQQHDEGHYKKSRISSKDNKEE